MSLILDGTNGVSDIDGSASTPAIRGTDTNTGIFFGTDIIGFSEGGAECARFNADAQFVAAAGTASLPVITTTGDVNTGIFFPAADTIAFAEGGAEAMRIDSSANLQFNSGYGSVATAYGCRAWVNFNGAANTNLSGTYSQSGTTVTVTATEHGLIAGNVVYSDITSGTGVDGTYTVATVTDANTFTYTAGTSLTTSGNITLRRSTIRASANVSSVADNSTGDYTINFSVAMPDANYSLTGACGALSASTGAGNYSLGIPGVSSFFTANGVKIQTWSTSNTQTDCFFINAAIFR